MPAFVKNTLKITGDSAQMEDFLTKSNGKIDFNAFFPITDDIEDVDQIPVRLRLWGTRYILQNPDVPELLEQMEFKVLRDDTGLIESMMVSFITPWTPPLLFFMNVQDLYPKLMFSLECKEEETGDEYTLQTRRDTGKPYFDVTDYAFKEIMKRMVDMMDEGKSI
jgi:hypothetical protein